MRPCAMIEPDKRVITQTYLYSWGFDNSQSITNKLMLFIQFCESQLTSFRSVILIELYCDHKVM